MPATFLLLLSFLGFVSLGLPDAVLGVAWPFLRSTFDLPQGGLGGILIGMAAGFFVSSTLAGRLIDLWGVGTLLATSTGLVALALFGFALAPTWSMVLLWTPVMGLGSGAIDAGLNAYASSRFSPRHMNWLHASYGLGTAVGPLIMTGVLSAGHSWRGGYGAVGGTMLLMTLLFLASRTAWRTDDQPAPPVSRTPMLRALLDRRVWLSIATFFTYTGLEMTAGAWCFALLNEGRGMSAAAAGLWTSVYWSSLFAGRLLLGLVADRIGPAGLVQLGVWGAVGGAALLAIAPTEVALAGLAVLGLSLAPIYPMLMLMTPRRFDAAVSFHVVGFQVSAAMLGGVLIPAAGGLLADAFGLEATAWLALATAAGLFLLHRRSRAAPRA